MTPTTPAAAGSAEPSVFDNFRHIKDQAGEYARARIALAKVEAKEAGSTAVWALVFAAAAGLAALLAYMLLVAGLVAVIAVALDGGWAWPASLGGIALLHALGGWLLLRAAKARWSSGFFTLSREQFAQEKEWLQRTKVC